MKRIGSLLTAGALALLPGHAARRRGGGRTGAGGDRPGRRPAALTAGGAQSIQYALWQDGEIILTGPRGKLFPHGEPRPHR